MASNNYASHTDSLGRDPHARIVAFRYPYSPWGENIAGGSPKAEETFDMWNNECDPDSSGRCTYGHRKNMLNPNFKVIGIGRAHSGDRRSYGWYWTTDFGGQVDVTIKPTAVEASLSLP